MSVKDIFLYVCNVRFVGVLTTSLVLCHIMVVKSYGRIWRTVMDGGTEDYDTSPKLKIFIIEWVSDVCI